MICPGPSVYFRSTPAVPFRAWINLAWDPGARDSAAVVCTKTKDALSTKRSLPVELQLVDSELRLLHGIPSLALRRTFFVKGDRKDSL